MITYCPECGNALKVEKVRKGNRYSPKKGNLNKNRVLDRFVCTNKECTHTELIVSKGATEKVDRPVTKSELKKFIFMDNDLIPKKKNSFYK